MPTTQTAHAGSALPSGTAQYHKISKLARALLLIYAAILDVVDVILKIAVLDDFFILDALWFPVSQVYFRLKGVNGTYNIVMSGAELIPYVGALPLRVIGCYMVIYIDSHPKAAAALGKAAAGKTMGRGGGRKAPPAGRGGARAGAARTPAYSLPSGAAASSGTESFAAEGETRTATASVGAKNDILESAEGQPPRSEREFNPFRATPYIPFSYEDDAAKPEDRTIDLRKKKNARGTNQQ